MKEQKQITPERGILSVEELCSFLGIGRNAGYELVKRPGFPAVRVSPRRIVIPIQALERWLDENAGL